ncbi:MAG: TolC family protein, partial [Elusimicrobia bacterium]|nr:TolC family protein [Elusimicrobiota bacterium]
VLLATASVAVQAQAPQAASSDTITLPQVLTLVERDNAEILAARARWRAAQQEATQAATLDKPRLDLERMYAPAGQNVINGAQEKNVAVTQEVPFPTTLYLRRDRAAKDALIAEEGYRAKLLEVRAKTAAAYADLFFSAKSAEIFGENVEIMRRFAKVAESRYAAGHASQLDALKAQVELTKMLNMTLEIEREREVAEATLDALLNRDAAIPFPAPADPQPGALTAKLSDLEATASALRPELRQAFLGAERARTSLSLAHSEFLPDFMLQYRWRRDPVRGNSNDAVLGLSLPLWFWKPAAMAAQAKAESEAADAELQAAKVETSSELKVAFVRARTSGRLAEVYRTSLLPQAQEALNVAEAGYQANETGFLDLLDAQRSLLDSRLEYYRYTSDYQRQLAELERVVGQELSTP